MGIPDGEYDFVLSDAVLAHLAGSSSLVGRGGPELMSLRYNEKPTRIDDSKPKEITVDGDTFKLLAASKDNKEKVSMAGEVSRSHNLECVVLYNEDSKAFEVKKVGASLLASKLVKSSPPVVTSSGSAQSSTTSKRSSTQGTGSSLAVPSDSEKKPLKKRKEPSIFQPKARARSPMDMSSTLKKTRLAAANSDDDTPLSLSRVGSPGSKRHQTPTNTNSSSSSNSNSNNTKPSAPSPLSSAHTPAATTTTAATGATSPLKHSTSASVLHTGPASTNSRSAPKMKLSQSASIPPPLPLPLPTSSRPQVSGKKPPSSAVSTPSLSVLTPTIAQQTPSDDIEDFADLVDELEEELSDENNVIVVEERGGGAKKRDSNDSLMMELSQSPMPTRPFNFRTVAQQENDEEDVTSSEEE